MRPPRRGPDQHSGHLRAVMFGWMLILCLLRPAHAANAGDDEVITAHIIPHSHCDPGWLSTFEGYYTSDVNRILDEAVNQLIGDSKRRFIWAEISFFSRWYEDQSLERKKSFRKLVDEGRWEFVGGGWAQNDEAASDIMLVVNQMTTGHQYLVENFGVQPRIGWQIDPFGHSSITPSLFKAMGFDALVINRIHHLRKQAFKRGRLMEFVWRGSGLGGDEDMFTHVLHTHYSAPKHFDWEEGAPQVNAGNVQSRSTQLCTELRNRMKAYRTPHLLVPFGDDFKFKNAANQFQNMDQLIKHINTNSATFKVKLRYSTLSEYFSTVAEWAQSKQTSFPLFMGDFFPYADNEDSYWTGYFTTRPFLKKLSRQVEASMRSAEALYAMARANINVNDNPAPAGLVDAGAAASHWMQTFEHIRNARREASMFSHHDAITGTCRSHVANDYVSRMNRALNTAHGIVESYLSLLLTKQPSHPIKLTHALRVLTQTPGSELTSHPIVLFNSLSWTRSEVVSIHVDSPIVYVTGPDGKPVEAQIDHVWANTQASAPSPTEFLLSFVANVPALGAGTYIIHLANRNNKPPGGHSETTRAVKSAVTEYVVSGNGIMAPLRGAIVSEEIVTADLGEGDKGNIFLENGVYRVEINSACLIRAITDKRKGGPGRVEINQNLARYLTRRSGAYIFRPEGPPVPVGPAGGGLGKCRVFRGKVADHVLGTTGDGAYGVKMTLPQGEQVLHALALQMSLEVSAGPNQELVTKMKTSLKNDHDLATHNGLEFVPRVRKGEKPVKTIISQNFWPAVYGAKIQGKPISGPGSGVLGILNSHALGLGSQEEGEVELMLHRQLNQDDGRGLSEAVRDGSRAEISIWITLDDKNPSFFDLHRLRLNNPLHVLLASSGENTDKTAVGGQSTNASESSLVLSSFSPLKAELPPYVHIMSLMVREGVTDEVLLRLQSLPGLRTGGFSLPFSKLFANLEVDRPSKGTLTANRHGAFPDRLRFGVSSETVDDATKKLDSARGEKQESQNTDEEGVFLSKSALERMRKLLNVGDGKEISVEVASGGIATYTVVLRDPMSPAERAEWLEIVKNRDPEYAKTLAKPKAMVFSPVSQFDSNNPFLNMPKNNPNPPVNIQNKGKNLAQPQKAIKPVVQALPPAKLASSIAAPGTVGLPSIPGMASHFSGPASELTNDAMLNVIATNPDSRSDILPSGFEYGFVMGAVSVAGLCLIVHLNVVSCGGDDLKKKR